MVYEGAVNDLNAAPTEMMPPLAIGGTALARSPADFGTTTSASRKTDGPRARTEYQLRVKRRQNLLTLG